jgi:hypothetical protein
MAYLQVSKLDNHMKLVIEMMVHDVPAEQIKM